MIQFATDNRRGFNSPKIAKVFCGDVDVTNVCTAFDADLGLATVLQCENGRVVTRRDGRVKRSLIRGAIRVEYEKSPVGHGAAGMGDFHLIQPA